MEKGFELVLLFFHDNFLERFLKPRIDKSIDENTQNAKPKVQFLV